MSLGIIELNIVHLRYTQKQRPLLPAKLPVDMIDSIYYEDHATIEYCEISFMDDQTLIERVTERFFFHLGDTPISSILKLLFKSK